MCACVLLQCTVLRLDGWSSQSDSCQLSVFTLLWHWVWIKLPPIYFSKRVPAQPPSYFPSCPLTYMYLPSCLGCRGWGSWIKLTYLLLMCFQQSSIGGKPSLPWLVPLDNRPNTLEGALRTVLWQRRFSKHFYILSHCLYVTSNHIWIWEM